MAICVVGRSVQVGCVAGLIHLVAVGPQAQTGRSFGRAFSARSHQRGQLRHDELIALAQSVQGRSEIQ